MDLSEEQVTTLNLKERSPVTPNEKNFVGGLESSNENKSKMDKGGIAEIDSKIIDLAPCSKSPKRIGPTVPPKPYKKKPDYPEFCASSFAVKSTCIIQVPQSYIVKQVCEPHYSKRLQSLTALFQRKYPVNTLHKISPNNVTLDNPVLLEQQLEALAHHKRQLEKRGVFSQPQSHNEKSPSDISDFPNLMFHSQAIDDCKSGVIYSNVRPTPSILNSPVFSLNVDPINADTKHSGERNTERNITQNLRDLKANRYSVENGRNLITDRLCGKTVRSQNEIYSNLTFEDNSQVIIRC
ncbi:uncharacterized protein LOC128869672 isoform X2 [Anastrepha ludens]|uniref:uncharacterized protein LOC128869672 isoform X2 n=1 Tax=Anastrepha ludens TaxID=28586 RepID=UPI0023B08C10|nr:uncharacterized protein LOC128869672 isoform X2 [Anastrepha ludens]